MIPIPSGEEVRAFRERLVKQQAADLAAVDGFLRLLSLPIATLPMESGFSIPPGLTEAEADQVVWATMESAMREAWFYLEPCWGAEDLWAVVRRRHPELESHRGVLNRQLYCLSETGELVRRGLGKYTCYRARDEKG